jgi:FlaA1/EpsC-like NDP-sugar epimerase
LAQFCSTFRGFTNHRWNKTLWRCFVQIMRAMIGLSIIVSACVIFLRLPLINRTVPLFFIAIAAAALLVKERLAVAYIRRRVQRGEMREPVLLAGTPEDIAALERTFAGEQKTLLEIVDRIDIGRRPISDLIEAMHRHA